MCYSALVVKAYKDATGRAEPSKQEWLDFFKNREKGSGYKLSRAFETPFLEIKNPDKTEKQIIQLIEDFNLKEVAKLEAELFKQKKRHADAERTLEKKETKKALNDKRVSTDKIENIKSKLKYLQKKDVSENDGRIFPFNFAPLIVLEKGKLITKPMRYHMRPKGFPESFDREYYGCYNARLDSIANKNFWKGAFGKNHGLLVIKSFWENVALHKYENRKLKKGEEEKNVVLHFIPKSGDYLLVPCLYDTNNEGEFELNSFALITDEPNPEVKACGHDRTPVFMKPEYVKLWLEAGSKDLEHYKMVFTDKMPTYFKNAVAA